MAVALEGRTVLAPSPVKPPKMLREIANDDLTPKKHDFVTQNELHEKIRNDDDYDDWEYGAEPLYESKNYNK